jgi:hypothetical protein
MLAATVLYFGFERVVCSHILYLCVLWKAPVYVGWGTLIMVVAALAT